MDCFMQSRQDPFRGEGKPRHCFALSDFRQRVVMFSPIVGRLVLHSAAVAYCRSRHVSRVNQGSQTCARTKDLADTLAIPMREAALG